MRWWMGGLAMLGAAAMAQGPAEGPVRVFFDWGKSEISRDAGATLDELVERYRGSGAAGIQLTGHSDRSGPDWANRRASLRRAEAVRDYLVGKGVPSAAISISAAGEASPIIATEDGVREAQNRRVEAVIVPAR